MGEKAYKGLGMEGPVARWYTKNTGKNRQRFVEVAQSVVSRAFRGARVLELAPGPGFCAIEIAKAGAFRVTGLDISETFVEIARDNAAREGVAVDFRHGNASAMPFPDASFDIVVCSAAFKNFSDPVGALDEIYRVLTPGGQASIYDLRKDAPREAIAMEVDNMGLSAINALITRLTFRFLLLPRAYSRDAVNRLVAQSHFRGAEIRDDGIGFELRLTKQGRVPRVISA